MLLKLSAFLNKLEEWQAILAMRKDISEAVEASTEKSRTLKGTSKDRVEEMMLYGRWLENNGEVFSQTEDVREEGCRLRKEIDTLTKWLEYLESDWKKGMENAKRLIAERNALIKKVGEGLKELTNRLGLWMYDTEKDTAGEVLWAILEGDLDSVSESDDTLEDECRPNESDA